MSVEHCYSLVKLRSGCFRCGPQVPLSPLAFSCLALVKSHQNLLSTRSSARVYIYGYVVFAHCRCFSFPLFPCYTWSCPSLSTRKQTNVYLRLGLRTPSTSFIQLGCRVYCRTEADWPASQRQTAAYGNAQESRASCSTHTIIIYCGLYEL